MSTATPAVRTRHPKQVTRRTILAKAYEMYVERRLVHGDERLADVLAELGRTTGSAYQIWTNQPEFRRELQTYVAVKLPYAGLYELTPELFARVTSERDGFDAQTEALAGHLYDTFTGKNDRDRFLLQLRFYGMTDERSEETTQALIEQADQAAMVVRSMVKPWIDRHDRRIAPPYDDYDLATSVVALTEGFALKASLADGRGVFRSMFCKSFTSIVAGMTRPADDL